jgi:hypothetical protein
MNESNPTAAPAVNGARLAKLHSPLFIWPATAALAVLLFFALSYLNNLLKATSFPSRPGFPAKCWRSTFWTTSLSARMICSWKLTRRITR